MNEFDEHLGQVSGGRKARFDRSVISDVPARSASGPGPMAEIKEAEERRSN